MLDPGSVARLGTRVPANVPVWIGSGTIEGQRVLVGLTDGHVRGGTVGVREAGVLTEMSTLAGSGMAAMLMCWDTGGVRVQEGPVALATASAVGVGLARQALQGPRLLTVISGPRGCFGAPSVIAALSQKVIITEDTYWGLTGPKLLSTGSSRAPEEEGRAATGAPQRYRRRHADALVADSAAAIRAEVAAAIRRPRRKPALTRVAELATQRTARLLGELRGSGISEAGDAAVPENPRPQRDLLRYSFRGQWRPSGPFVRRGLVQAAWGLLEGRGAMSVVVGPDPPGGTGIGIEEAHAISAVVDFAVRQPDTAPILIFLFCQGHSSQIQEERNGLHVALARCLESLVAARLLGHPLLCVLGGGAYGAAYLSLAAPCHRILAMRGTSVAPMAPPLLAAFRRLRGMREAPQTPPNLAELIPEIRMVDSVVRLPRAMREELERARGNSDASG